MNRILPIYVGLRYLRARRRNQYVSFVTLVALMGMILGVTALIVILSVMNGFDRELRNRILHVVPHGYIESEQGLSNWTELLGQLQSMPDVVGVAPYVNGVGMISVNESVKGIELIGIDPDIESQVSVIHQHLIDGHWQSLSERRYGMILGSLVARELGVVVGDQLTVALPQVSVTPMGLFPRMKRFTVVGIYEVGAQLDHTSAIIHWRDGARLFGGNKEPQGLRLRFSDLFQAPELVAKYAQSLGPQFTGKDWSQTQSGLFQAIQMEKTVVTSLLLIVVAVAAFNIVSILTMAVADRRTDIAVLRTMGASPQTIMAIFVVQGGMIGLFGAFFGVMIGAPLAYYISDVVKWLEGVIGLTVFDPNVYYISFLPSEVLWQDVVFIAAMAFAMGFLATIYPAYRAACIHPAEALRYDG